MDITQRLKEIILTETNVNVEDNSRKRNIIEVRSLYYNLIKHYKPNSTLTSISESVNKNHATILHSLNKYNMYEHFNDDLRHIKNIIIAQIDDERFIDLEDTKTIIEEYKRQRIEIEELKSQLKLKNGQLLYKFPIIEQLNKLMLDTQGTEKQILIKDRLEAYYTMNKIR